MKKEVERKTGMRCAVVYGRLPPEIRSEQTALSNDPVSGYDVIIGSDAIGMGLNLKIRRIIFESVSKSDDSACRPLRAPRPQPRRLRHNPGPARPLLPRQGPRHPLHVLAPALIDEVEGGASTVAERLRPLSAPVGWRDEVMIRVVRGFLGQCRDRQKVDYLEAITNTQFLRTLEGVERSMEGNTKIGRRATGQTLSLFIKRRWCISLPTHTNQTEPKVNLAWLGLPFWGCLTRLNDDLARYKPVTE